MSIFVPRVLEATIHKYLELFPVIGITGPRQSGKSTLLIEKFSNYQYVNFDDPQVVMHLNDDPKDFMQTYNHKVIFDEAQKAPALFNYVKIAVDKDRDSYGKFILTGSSQFILQAKITESLAGRIGLLQLLPLQYTEIPEENRKQSIYCGCYPELVKRDYKGFIQWYQSYVETYINKDVRSISNIGNLIDFQKFMLLLAANTSQQLNMTEYSKKIGVSITSIKNWLAILEASYVIFLLPPFYENFGKRLIKSPKVYFWDTGLVAYLTGIETYKQYNQGPMSGSLFENYVISEIYKKELHSNMTSKLYYLRTNHGIEVDLIIDRKNHKELIEIKKSATFKSNMVANLKKFLSSQDEGLLLYNGEEMQHSAINIKSIDSYLRNF